MIFYFIMVFLMPFHNHPILSASIFGITTIKIAGILATLSAIYRYLSGAKFMATSRIIIPVLLFTMAFLLSLNANATVVSSTSGQRFGTAIALFFCTSILVDNPKSYFRVLLVMLVSMNISSLYMVKQVMAGLFRPGGTFGDANYYAIAASFAIAVSVVFFYSLKRYRYFFIISALLNGIGLILSQSRGGFLALVVSFLFYWWKGKNKIKGGLVGIFSVVVLLTLIPNGMMDRLQNKDYGARSSTEHRMKILGIGFDLFKSSPIVGVGPGMFKKESVEFYEQEEDARIAHNSYLEVLAELGLCGFIPFVWLCFALKTELQKKSLAKETPYFLEYQKSKEAILVGIVGYFVGSLFLSVEYEKIFWLSISLAAIFEKVAKNNKKIQE